jgi:hypothetical protein
MLSRIREHFGSAGLVVAIVALVAALAGGAIAANGGADGGKATASAKGKPGPRGKTGKTGPAGPAGPAGAPGPAGPQGPAGANGAPGAQGATGPTGKTGSAGEAGAEGPTGPAGPSCNENGECLLPVGATETGVWSFRVKGVLTGFATVSFPLRVPGGVSEFHYVSQEEMQTQPAIEEGCPGTNIEPAAAPGILCVYEGNPPSGLLVNANPPTFPLISDSTSGLVLNFGLTAEAQEEELEAKGTGTWAISR